MHNLPAIGQRCLVYDKRYKCWTFAYWTRDNRFEEWQNGKMRIVNWQEWKPEPEVMEHA